MTVSATTSAEVTHGTAYVDVEGLDSLFRPTSIAILGASNEVSKIGGRPLRFLKESGFEGNIYPVNPKYDEVQGLKAYPSLAAIEGDVEMVIIALPKPFVKDAFIACAAKNVKVVTLFSAGFAEESEEGAALQNELSAFARANGMRVLGPNCLGSASRKSGATATFAAVEAVEKPDFRNHSIALVSQSGAIAAAWLIQGLVRGINFDPWVSTGNEADIDIADCIAYLALDDEVKVIAVYMEGCRNGDKLREALKLAYERKKPVVMLKVGRSDVGAKAAASHTASLVGSDQIFDALFRQYNVCRVDSLTELLDTVYAFSASTLPTGDKVGLMTGSGGVGILMADVATEVGLDVAPLPDALQASLKEVWPAAGVGNPIDTTAQLMNDGQLLSTFLQKVLGESDFDTVVLFLSYMGLLKPWSDTLVEAVSRAMKSFPDANLIVAMTATPEVREAIEDLGIIVYEEPVTAVHVAARMARTGMGFARAADTAVADGSSVSAAGTGELTEVAATQLLAQAGVPVLPTKVVTSSDEAKSVSQEFEFPVVMKIVSPDILHKTEAGGVALGISSPDEAAAAYEKIIASAAAYDADARIEGVMIAPMIRDGVETIIGVLNDPAFGPTVMFGLGGVFVEVLKDVTYRLAPFDRDVALEMIHEIKGFALLDGARGAAPADIDALANTLSDLSIFAADNRDHIESIDLNPFLVRPVGKGAVAVDALITRIGH